MRLIDADAFSEFLKDAVKQQKYENTKIDRLLTVADVIEAVISELEGTSLVGFKNAPTIEPEPHWIPCSERYPEQDERVFVAIGDYDYFVWDCMSNRGDDYFWEDEQGFYHNKYEVIAWMPMPEPYRGEQG